MIRSRRSLRWHIAQAYTLVIVLTLSLLSLALWQVARATYLQTLEAGLAGQARLIAAWSTNTRAPLASEQLHVFVAQGQGYAPTRISLITVKGIIAVDTLAAAVGANVDSRPEVQDALAQGQGESERYSAAIGENSFFVAVPIGSPNAPSGVARVGVPLTTIAQAQTHLALLVFVVACLASAGTVALAMLIARRVTQPLLDVRAMAGRFADGDLTAQVPIPADEEVAALAQTFNAMASRVRQLIDLMRAERQRLTTILATMTDGILIVDTDDRITLTNAAAAHMLQLAPSALPIPLTQSKIGPGILPTLRRHARIRRPTDPAIVDDLTLEHPPRILRAIVTPLATPESPQMLVLLQDVTALRRAERARHLLLTNLSHDLRTPLASLQAMLETLQDGALDDRPAAMDFLQRMDAEVNGLSRLVNAFLELSRIESGQLQLTLAPLDLPALLTTAVSRMAPQADHYGITLQLDLPANLPRVEGDVLQIERVVLNLLQNALTFTPSGGTITLMAARQDDAVCIAVHDTGVGIAAADLPYIFERFYKADQARHGGGSGLGLAIAKHLVELHGGRIWATSVPHHGTTIAFTLPCTPPSLILDDAA